jgi:hypothetical protein
MSTVDMLIFVHPEFDRDVRTDLERKVEGCVGVDCAEFAHRPHSHALVVKYDPEAIRGSQILEVVRTIDPEATKVGL